MKDFSAATDFNGTGTFTNIDRQFARIYYWLHPAGHRSSDGFRTQCNPVSEQFNLATMFQRMLESMGGQDAIREGAADVQYYLSAQSGSSQVDAAACAQSYRVQTYGQDPSRVDGLVPGQCGNILHRHASMGIR